MEGLSCAQVQQWLHTGATPVHGSEDAAGMVEHVRHCQRCQAALVLLSAADLPRMPALIECDQCQERLPAYLDLEMRPGGIADPDVWWHLWTCADCLEIYEVTRTLLDATEQGRLVLPAPAPTSSGRRLVHLLRLTRQFLTIALPPLQPAVTRGGQDDATVLSEGPAMDGTHYFLTVAAEQSGTWKIIVTVIPAPAGILRLSLGDALFRARFDSIGQASIANVPAALLAAADGPDLVMDIELEDES